MTEALSQPLQPAHMHVKTNAEKATKNMASSVKRNQIHAMPMGAGLHPSPTLYPATTIYRSVAVFPVSITSFAHGEIEILCAVIGLVKSEIF